VRNYGALVAVAALALAVPGAAHAASPAKNSVYSGETSQGEVLSFVTSKNGKRVIDLATTLTYRCTGAHDGQGGSFILDEIKVKGGRFRSTQELQGTSELSVVQSGTGIARGTFKRRGKRVSGKIRSQLTLRDGETCDSGLVTYAVTLL
jgi:hypothetical protein